MNRLLRKIYKTGFFHIFGTTAINKVIAFLSSAILVRILTKDEYGVFAYSWNVYNVLMLFSGFGAISAILQLSSEIKDDLHLKRNIYIYGTKYAVSFNIILVVLILGIYFFVDMPFQESKRVFLLLFMLPLVQVIYDIVLVILRSEKRNIDYSRIISINAYSLSIVSVIGAYLFREIGLILSYYFSFSMCILYAYKYLRINILPKVIEFSEQSKKDFFNIACISTVNSAISQLLYYIDVLVLGYIVVDQATIAEYKVATIIPNALVFIPSTFVTYIYPYFAENRFNRDWCLNKYKLSITFMFFVNTLIVTVLYFFAEHIFMVLYGSAYQSSIPIFNILILSYFFSATFRIIAGNLLVTQRKLTFNLFVAILCGIINIISDYYFIQHWGSIGAAYATFIVVLVSSAMNVTYLLYTFKHIS